MQRLLAAISAVMLLMTTGIGLAQEAKTPRQKAEQGIRNLLTELEESFNRGDAKGLAACWTPGGDFVDYNGERAEGRDRIEKGFRESLAARNNSKLQLLVLSLRIVSDDLALVDAIPEVKPTATPLAGEPSLNLVLVKRNDRWLIESAHETIGRASSQVQHLKDLEWLVGDWASEAAPQSGISLRSTCDWTENRAFLIRKFKVEGTSGVFQAGTEVIGWDPHVKRIRSWVFESNGGFGENVWVRDGNRWLVKFSGTLADGSEVSATNVLTIVDASTLTLLSKDRTANGEPQSDVPAITIKRQVVAKDASQTEEPSRPPRRILP